MELYSNNGVLRPRWIEVAGFNRLMVKSIRVASGTVYLPEEATGYGSFRCRLFGGLSNVRSIDLRGFDTSRSINMEWLFFGCERLESLDVSMFDTSNVKLMSGMFESCTSLKTLNIQGFNTEKVISMSKMFKKCRQLETLDLRHFDLSNVRTMMNMFEECNSMKTLYMNPSIERSTITENIFAGCPENMEVMLI